ncbi:MAG TPA: cation-efflux pump [Peptococcaceae bacterium]|nr:cation-efflux pump [Peptococcaceae bacterium]
MNQYLIKLFIRNYQDTGNPKVREQYGKMAGGVGIVSNLVLFVMKIVTGIVFNSISIMADAVNNLTDSASSVVTLVGFKLAGKPADKEHPFGHARFEYITGLVVSFAILVLGLQLIKTSAEKILHPEPIQFSMITVAILLAAIAIKVWQSRFNKRVGETIRSTALIATAADSRNDVIATSTVLASAIISRLTGLQLDGLMGVGVAAFIIYSGINLIKETLSPLLGTVPDKELVEKVRQKIMSYEGIIGHHDLIIHNYGPGRCFASVHAEVPASQDIMVSHDIIDNMEADFFREMNMAMVIHMDPIITDDERTNHLYSHLVEILEEISPDIMMHDFRVVIGPDHSNLIFDVAIDFDFPINDTELCEEIDKRVRQMNPQCHTAVKVDRSFV